MNVIGTVGTMGTVEISPVSEPRFARISAGTGTTTGATSARGLTFATVIETSTWEPLPAMSTDGTRRVISDPAVRSCSVATKQYKLSTNIPDGAVNSWQLLQYKPGGHFILHGDTKHHPSHSATVLIFPPSIRESHINMFKGGDLVYVDVDGIEQTIRPSEFDEWQSVIIPLGVSHKVMAVTEGIRYVFKSIIDDNVKTATPRTIIEARTVEWQAHEAAVERARLATLEAYHAASMVSSFHFRRQTPPVNAVADGSYRYNSLQTVYEKERRQDATEEMVTGVSHLYGLNFGSDDDDF